MIRALSGLCGLLAIMLVLTNSAHATEIPVTAIYDGVPPVRYQNGRTMEVSFGTLYKCGPPPKGKVFEGCMRYGLFRNIVHMPNPCNFTNEYFARIMCHEMGHMNGWPKLHGK